MMESDEKNDVKWGNKLGYILLPFHIHEHNDPLEYVIKAKKVADRKKHSLEAIFTRFITEVTTKCFSIKVNLYTCGMWQKARKFPLSKKYGPNNYAFGYHDLV